MRRGGGDAVVPGNDIPGQGPNQAAKDDVMIHEGGIYDALANGGRHLELKDPEGDKVEGRGEEHRLLGGQGTGSHDGGNGVCPIVETIHEVEGQGHRDEEDQGPGTNEYCSLSFHYGFLKRWRG